MNLLTDLSIVKLWQETLRHAEETCATRLLPELESYLIYLLIEYTTRPDIAKQVISINFLQSLQATYSTTYSKQQRAIALQAIGDQCLLLAGLFPGIAERKQVDIGYFVKIGRAAYRIVSKQASDLYYLLALQFVTLMDILQSMHCHADLLPLQAYEQWSELGSKRALKILQRYTNGMPIWQWNHK